MLMNMAVALVMHEQIQTTLVKAKVLRPFVERLLTIAKKPNLANHRRLLSILHSSVAVKKLVDVLATRYAQRNGGYLRIVKAGFRYGDMASMAYIEFVDRDVNAKGFRFDVGSAMPATDSAA